MIRYGTGNCIFIVCNDGDAAGIQLKDREPQSDDEKALKPFLETKSNLYPNAEHLCVKSAFQPWYLKRRRTMKMRCTRKQSNIIKYWHHNLIKNDKLGEISDSLMVGPGVFRYRKCERVKKELLALTKGCAEIQSQRLIHTKHFCFYSVQRSVMYSIEPGTRILSYTSNTSHAFPTRSLRTS